MNTKIILLVVGLVVGGLVGFLTRPQATEIKLGPISMEVQTDQTAAPGDAVTSGQWEHIAIFSAIGALVGLGLGFAAARRRSI
jgi:hypothetical protein